MYLHVSPLHLNQNIRITKVSRTRPLCLTNVCRKFHVSCRGIFSGWTWFTDHRHLMAKSDSWSVRFHNLLGRIQRYLMGLCTIITFKDISPQISCILKLYTSHLKSFRSAGQDRDFRVTFIMWPCLRFMTYDRTLASKPLGEERSRFAFSDVSYVM